MTALGEHTDGTAGEPFEPRHRRFRHLDFQPVRWVLGNRFLRFLIVGAINTVFGYSVFAALILLKVPYPVAAFLATVLGVLFNFKSYGRLVFGSHDNRLIFRFFGVYGVCYLLGLAPLAWAKAHGVPILLMAALCALPMAAIGFLLNRRFVFRHAR